MPGDGDGAMERLQKFLARAGVASRRQAEKMILAGRVRVNGAVVTELGTKVEPEQDRVEVDGNPVTLEIYYYILISRRLCDHCQGPVCGEDCDGLVRISVRLSR